ncbi:MAG: DNA-formamidopyrimidine glycosylase family protein [Acidimicrobiales bacterium]
MPEGDTIHRTASRLAGALVGRVLTRFDAPRGLDRPGRSGPPAAGSAAPGPGSLIEAVEARGKYLLIRFGDGSVLETHMKMTGSWHLYRPGERWRRPPSTVRVVVGTDEWLAVCFAAPHAVLHRPSVRARTDPAQAPPGPTHLGPDLCREDAALPDADVAEILHRLRTLVAPDTRLDTALLDQRLFCGVGNVYKSEVLAAAGLHPATPLAAVDDGQRRQLATIAHRLLRANTGRTDRVTVPGGLAVYGRAGRPCRRCGTPIERALTGPHHRSTYWCPACQSAPGAAAAPAPTPGMGVSAQRKGAGPAAYGK